MYGTVQSATVFDELVLAVLGKDSPKALDIIKNRAREIPNINLADPDDYNQRTLLHYAAENGMREVAGALLNAGARHNILDYANMVPAELALNFGHLTTLEVILNHLRRTDHNELRALLNTPDPVSNITLLHLAILDGNLDAVKMLVGQFGAQVTQENIAEADNPTNGRPVNLELGAYLRQQRNQQQGWGLSRVVGWVTGWGGSQG